MDRWTKLWSASGQRRPWPSEETDEGVPGMNRTLLRAVLVGYGGAAVHVERLV